eukprot:TRINITY_DN4709_c0_g1_i2.p2 TRINITY_DN4709_c0_g1~~TRINITY_DN4709_c0_g1_i2.p2  ORF type:complete len:142 (+),score=51.64 TRINITY_DN4709_c0_g1_i2:66-491(+)
MCIRDRYQRRVHGDIQQQFINLEMAQTQETIFDKILDKRIPATVVYEDDQVLAFRDVHPQAPVHVLIIPKNKDGLNGISRAEERHIQILGHLLYSVKIVADKLGLENGYRIVINDGQDGGCLLYTSPSPRDRQKSRMPSSA